MQTRAMRAFFTLVAGSLICVGCETTDAPTTPVASNGPRSAVSAATSGVQAAASASSHTTVVSIPVGFTIQPSGKAAIVACVGESITFGGDARVVATQTILPDGSMVLDRLHINPQGATATGNSSGIVYRLVGADNTEAVTAPSGGVTVTFSANLIVIGPGASKNFTAHILQHITITPTGAITSFIDVFDVDCK